jgi:O-antigen/teichoic acid export membrane protein
MAAEDRSVLVGRNTRASVIRNLVGVVVSLTTVPLVLRALGTEGYGTFQVIASLGNLAAMTDIGLGLALLTRVGQLAGAQDFPRIRQTIGGALMVIGMLVLVLALAAIATLRLVDVPGFLKIPASLRGQATNGFLIVLAAFVIRMPLSVFSAAHGGLQIGDRLLKWNIGSGSAASCAMAAVALLTRRIDLAIGVQLALTLFGTMGAVRLGFRIQPATIPVFRMRDLSVGWELLRSGFFYYLLQLELTVIGGLDNIVISKIVGVEAVALYSVAFRVISLPFSMVYSLGASFWAGVSHAVGNHDYAWIRSSGARLRQLGSLWMAVFSGGFAAVGVQAIALWTGNRLRIDPLVPIALGAYFALLGHTMIDASILNGAEKIRQQVITVGVDAGLNLLMSVWLTHHLGYVGVGLGTLFSYSLCTFVPLQLFSWKLVVGGPRPAFWTRELSTMVLAVAMGFGINRIESHLRGLSTLASALIGGSASLLITLLLIRLIVGVEGLDALRRSLRRSDRTAIPVGT